MVEWSAYSPWSPTIRVRILLKFTIFQKSVFLKTKRDRGWPVKKLLTLFEWLRGRVVITRSWVWIPTMDHFSYQFVVKMNFCLKRQKINFKLLHFPGSDFTDTKYLILNASWIINKRLLNDYITRVCFIPLSSSFIWRHHTYYYDHRFNRPIDDLTRIIMSSI